MKRKERISGGLRYLKSALYRGKVSIEEKLECDGYERKKSKHKILNIGYLIWSLCRILYIHFI